MSRCLAAQPFAVVLLIVMAAGCHADNCSSDVPGTCPTEVSGLVQTKLTKVTVAVADMKKDEVKYITFNGLSSPERVVSSYCPGGFSYKRHVCGKGSESWTGSDEGVQYGPYKTNDNLSPTWTGSVWDNHCSCCCNCDLMSVECSRASSGATAPPPTKYVAFAGFPSGEGRMIGSYCPSGLFYKRHVCGSGSNAWHGSGSVQYGPFSTDEKIRGNWISTGSVHNNHCSCCCNCDKITVECVGTTTTTTPAPPPKPKKATCDSFTCHYWRPLNKGSNTQCLGEESSCDDSTCCESRATCLSFPCPEGLHAKVGFKCPTKEDSCDATLCCAPCDYQCYLDRYPNLGKVIGKTNTKAAKKHFEDFGKKEKRYCTCPSTECNWRCYLNRYPGVAKAFGADNLNMAQIHYERFGAQEGRNCAC